MLQESIPIFDPRYLRDLTEVQANHLFRSSTSTEIPQFSKRIEVLRVRPSSEVILLKVSDWSERVTNFL